MQPVCLGTWTSQDEISRNKSVSKETHQGLQVVVGEGGSRLHKQI